MFEQGRKAYVSIRRPHGEETMLSPRRSAQLGLGIACLILVSSVAVLVAGAADPANSKANIEVSNVPAAVTQSPVGNDSLMAVHSNALLSGQH
jgi:hypothetical protein